jgi:hypothetical protein
MPKKTGPVVEMVAKILGRSSAHDLRSPLSEKDRIKLEKVLKGLKVVVTHRGPMRRRYRITRITATTASRTMFPVGEPVSAMANLTNAPAPLPAGVVEDTVANYFLNKYRMALYFPHLPCLVVGDPDKCVYLPMEVCDVVPGQRHLRKLNERQVFYFIF